MRAASDCGHRSNAGDAFWPQVPDERAVRVSNRLAPHPPAPREGAPRAHPHLRRARGLRGPHGGRRRAARRAPGLDRRAEERGSGGIGGRRRRVVRRGARRRRGPPVATVHRDDATTADAGRRPRGPRRRPDAARDPQGLREKARGTLGLSAETRRAHAPRDGAPGLDARAAGRRLRRDACGRRAARQPRLRGGGPRADVPVPHARPGGRARVGRGRRTLRRRRARGAARRARPRPLPFSPVRGGAAATTCVRVGAATATRPGPRRRARGVRAPPRDPIRRSRRPSTTTRPRRRRRRARRWSLSSRSSRSRWASGECLASRRSRTRPSGIEINWSWLCRILREDTPAFRRCRNQHEWSSPLRAPSTQVPGV